MSRLTCTRWRTSLCSRLVCVALFVATFVLGRADGASATQPKHLFFAFDNGTGRDEHVPLETQAAMLKELGYAGIGYTGTKRIPKMLAALDARGLTMFSIYVGACVDPGKPAYDQGLKQAISQLKGRPTVIWLFITGGTPSSTTLDDRAVAIVREVSDMAAKSNLRIALYPHIGFYVARVEDALRLAKKVDRKNVGVTFNLSHFLKLDDEKNLEQRLKEAAPYLFLVSINGADSGQTNEMDWDRLIQTLDRGTFNVRHLLRALDQCGYTGPVGLQCYAIPGNSRENLQRSMRAWQKLGD